MFGLVAAGYCRPVPELSGCPDTGPTPPAAGSGGRATGAVDLRKSAAAESRNRRRFSESSRVRRRCFISGGPGRVRGRRRLSEYCVGAAMLQAPLFAFQSEPRPADSSRRNRQVAVAADPRRFRKKVTCTRSSAGAADRSCGINRIPMGKVRAWEEARAAIPRPGPAVATRCRRSEGRWDDCCLSSECQTIPPCLRNLSLPFKKSNSINPVQSKNGNVMHAAISAIVLEQTSGQKGYDQRERSPGRPAIRFQDQAEICY